MDEIKKKETLIRVDKNAIERTKQYLRTRTELLNKFVEVSENTLKANFDDKEKINLKDNGLDFVNEWIKPKFKFPDADDTFNLQALGIDLAPIRSFWDANQKQWKSLPVEINNGKFIIQNMDALPEVTKHYYYAKNERQEKAFKKATEICKALNRLLDKGLIIHGKERDISFGFEFVRFGTETNESDYRLKRMFFPNEWRILEL
jgi:hypothetical protein